MKVLYITNITSDKEIKSEHNYVYNLNTGNLITKNGIVLNNANKLNEYALKYRDKYSDFIYSINKDFINENLIYKNNLSIYGVSVISNKRTEKYDAYVTVLHFIIIKEFCIEQNIDEVISIGLNQDEYHTLLSGLSGLKINVKSLNVRKTKNRLLLLRQLKFFVLGFFKVLFSKLLLRDKKKITHSEWFVSRYPIHFDTKLLETKYVDLLNPETTTCLVSILTDGFHQNLNLQAYFKAIVSFKKQILKSKQNFVVLDTYIRAIDFFRSFSYYIAIRKRFKKLWLKQRIFEGFEFSLMLKVEFEDSLLQVPRLVLNESAYVRVFEKYKPERVTYFLHEYTYGRFITFIIHNWFPKIKSRGFQHGPASLRKMLYALSKKEASTNANSFIKQIPIPQEVLAEDELSKTIYEKAGYVNVKKMDYIPRLFYLNDIKRKTKKNTVMVACGLHDAIFIYNFLQNEIAINKHKKYFFKLHPRANNKEIIQIISKSNFNNISLAENNVTYYLSIVDEVISTYSSVGNEAYILGIKSRTISLPNKINESSLLDLS